MGARSRRRGTSWSRALSIYTHTCASPVSRTPRPSRPVDAPLCAAASPRSARCRTPSPRSTHRVSSESSWLAATVSTGRACATSPRSRVPVTCDVTPHHLAMTDEWVAGSRALAWEVEDEALLAVPYDSSTKVNPPLRGRADVRALWAGLVDGTVDAIATDHAPYASVKKDVEFDQAAFGISGLETALALVLGGVGVHWAALGTVIDALTIGPARVLGIEAPRGDWTVIDRDAEWVVCADELASKGKNTPLIGRTLTGRVVATVVGGELRYEGGARVAETISRR